MTSPPDDTLFRPLREARPQASRLVHLRIDARVVSCAERVRLVGEGTAVEITPLGASTAHLHNELVMLPLGDVVGETPAEAARLLERWKALDQHVRVDVVTLRADDSLPRAGRRVEITGRDGAVLRWHEPGATEAQRSA